MKLQIKNRWNDNVLFEGDADSILELVQLALQQGADLMRANLDGANLYGAHLYGANLYGANLTRANLDGANLYGANLYGANLTRANLDGANLDGANLFGANLTRANLTRANLSRADLMRANLDGANLDGANLDGANLDGANLTPVRDDFWAVLSSAPCEARGLREALIAGKIDGSTYKGECACLVGTIANVCHTRYDALDCLKPNSDRAAERFFLLIKPGQTPENNKAAKLVLGWLDQWIGAMEKAFGAPEK
jgi:hypothetical protein